MVKTILIVIVLAFAGLLVFAATRPDSFMLQRSLLIQAPPDKLHPLINDMRAFNTWNPYEKKDPAIQGSYSGPAAGPGARYVFKGNQDVGEGSLEITASSPGQIAMRLDMSAPMQASNAITFTLVPRGAGGTEVTWAMRGACPFIAKLMGVFIDMDKMIGRDFEAGLASLQLLAERR